MNTGTLDEECSAASSKEAAFFAQTAVSRFEEQYTPEMPDEVDSLVRSAISVLSSLKRQGFDISCYLARIQDTALRAEQEYDGDMIDVVKKSTLHVLDGIIYKKDTGYQRNRKRITDMFRKEKK